MDPLSTTAGVIGIVAATVHAIHVVIKVIDNIDGAPSTIRDLRQDLANTMGVVEALGSSLKDSAMTAFWTNMFKETRLPSAIDTLRTICENTSKCLEAWTRHSNPGGKLSFRDGFTLAFHDTKISQLRTRFISCKETVA